LCLLQGRGSGNGVNNGERGPARHRGKQQKLFLENVEVHRVYSYSFLGLFRLDASVLGGTLSVFPQGRGSGNGVIQVKVMRYDTGCIISPSNDEVYSVSFSASQ